MRIAVLILALVCVQGTVQAQDAVDDTDPLHGRVGGTELSWIEAYGDIVPSEDPRLTFVREFDLDGASTGLANVKDGFVYSVMIFAPRAEGEEWESGDNPHEMNWSVPGAQAMALEYLPRDVVLLEQIEERQSGSLLTQNCESPTLLSQVPTAIYDFTDNTPVYGGCSYWLNIDDAGGVTWILVELEIEEPLTSP